MRAAVAVELVHSATLVHDDLIDGAALRRGHPTVAAAAGRGRRSRPATCCSRGPSRSSRATGPRAAAGALGRQLGARRGRAAAARGRLRARVSRRALPEPLRAEDGGAVRGRLPAGGAPAGEARARSPTRSARSRGASGWPSRCSTTCSTSPARSSAPASRAAPTCSTAPSRCRSSSRASASRSSRAFDLRSLRGAEQAEALCERIAATGRARAGARAGAGGRRRGQGGAPRSCQRTLGLLELVADAVVERCWTCVADAVVERYSCSEVAGRDQVGVQRAHEELDFLGHVGVGHAPQVARAARGAAVELVVEALRRPPARRHPRGATRTRGSAARSRQWRAPSSHQSSG